MLNQPQRIYRAIQPRSTHFRPGTCEEARCPHFLKGWQTIIDESSQFGQAQARYIRVESKREFRATRDQQGLTVFVFTPGQKCFRQHEVFNQRPAFALIGGREVLALDPRNPAHVPGMERLNRIGDDWVDDSKEHLYRLKRLEDRG